MSMNTAQKVTTIIITIIVLAVIAILISFLVQDEPRALNQNMNRQDAAGSQEDFENFFSNPSANENANQQPVTQEDFENFFSNDNADRAATGTVEATMSAEEQQAAFEAFFSSPSANESNQ